MKTSLILLMAVVFVASGCAVDSTSENPEENDAPEEGDVLDPDEQLEQTEQDETEANDTSNRSEADVTVNYTVSGFEPSTVTIDEGDTVRWQAESGTFWVGSDQHPSHTEYDDTSTNEHCENGQPTSDSVFDQCSAGESFSFTFEKSGEWGYDNHRYSQHEGTVVVE